MTTKGILPFEATHPGILISDEIKERNIKQKELAIEIGVLPTFLNEIIKGKRAVTADFAILLEKALEIPADLWMKFQSQYEIDKARLKEKNIRRIELMEIWNIIKSYVPIKYFKKLNYLSESIENNISIIKIIYQVKTIDGLVNAVAEYKATAFYRKSDKLQVDKLNMLAWSKLAEYEAEKVVLRKFDPDNIDQLKKELIVIFTENINVKEKTRLKLKEYGIKLVYIPKFEKTPIDGFSLWSNENPAIVLTLRHKRIDNFAFTIFHELGHVDLHLQKEKDRKFIDLINSKQKDVFEQQADNYAQIGLINNNQWNDFSNNFMPFDDQKINVFAKKHNINPAIVLGRICWENNYYAVKSSINKTLN